MHPNVGRDPAQLCPVTLRGACGRYRDLIRGLSGQQIADCHSRAAVPTEHNDITGFDFVLHRVATGIHRTSSHANRPAEFACADQNIRRALLGRAFQLRSQFVREVIDRNHVILPRWHRGRDRRTIRGKK
jgi:hypothetical protein